MTLFDECVEALGVNTRILSDKETRLYFNELVDKFPVTEWARIDWSKVSRKHLVEDVNEIPFLLRKMGANEVGASQVILLWNYSDEPAVISDLQSVLHAIDDVTAVGSDTFIYCPSLGYVIEFYHEGDITIGFF